MPVTAPQSAPSAPAQDTPGGALRVGQILKSSLYAEVPGSKHPVLLMRAGQRIETLHQLERLKEAGFSIDLNPLPVPQLKVEGPSQKIPGLAGSRAQFAESLRAAQAARKVLTNSLKTLQAVITSGGVPNWQEMVGAGRQLAEMVKSDPHVSAALTHLMQCDDYLLEHSADVGILMVAIGKTLGFPEEELDLMALGGLLHDVGKQKVPKGILEKPGKPSPEEWEEIRRHPEYGREILEKCDPPCPPEVIRVAAQHHERMDGSGYPNCLKGDQIAVHSRIAAVADVFDAITSHRVYHRGRTAREALMIIYTARTEYDQDAVMALVKLVGVYPVGTRVRLDSGEQGVVVAPNLEDSTRPVVEIDADQGGRPVAPYQLSLRGGSARIVGIATR